MEKYTITKIMKVDCNMLFHSWPKLLEYGMTNERAPIIQKSQVPMVSNLTAGT